MLCLLKARGRIRARTRRDWEQVVQWKRERVAGGDRGVLQTGAEL